MSRRLPGMPRLKDLRGQVGLRSAARSQLVTVRGAGGGDGGTPARAGRGRPTGDASGAGRRRKKTARSVCSDAAGGDGRGGEAQLSVCELPTVYARDRGICLCVVGMVVDVAVEERAAVGAGRRRRDGPGACMDGWL